MDFQAIKDMWQLLWDYIYAILEIFGIKKDEEGNLVEGE